MKVFGMPSVPWSGRESEGLGGGQINLMERRRGRGRLRQLLHEACAVVCEQHLGRLASQPRVEALGGVYERGQRGGELHAREAPAGYYEAQQGPTLGRVRLGGRPIEAIEDAVVDARRVPRCLSRNARVGIATWVESISPVATSASLGVKSW
jgi:hypothetical protein